MSSNTLAKPRRRWHAAIYARFIEPQDRKKLAPIRRTVVGGAAGRVLEIGAGTGANLPYYDWSKVESLQITEPDPFMLEHLRRKLEALPADVRARVDVREILAEQLPFADASFDDVVVTLALCTVYDPARSLAELHRVLKPGGRLRLIEHVRAQGFWAKLQRWVQPVYGWLAGDCRLDRDTEQSLRDSGFEVQITERLSLGGPLWPAFVALATRP